MKNFTYAQQMEFDCMILDLAESLDIHTKDDLEWFITTLHERIEIAAIDYAADDKIDDYEPQY